MASFPGSFAVFNPRTNYVDTVFDTDVNLLQQEIRAIQEVLGTNPQGSFPNVRERISGSLTNHVEGQDPHVGTIAHQSLKNLSPDQHHTENHAARHHLGGPDHVSPQQMGAARLSGTNTFTAQQTAPSFYGNWSPTSASTTPESCVFGFSVGALQGSGWPISQGQITTVKRANNHVMQFVSTDLVDGQLWFRTGANSTWGPFKKIGEDHPIQEDEIANHEYTTNYEWGDLVTVGPTIQLMVGATRRFRVLISAELAGYDRGDESPARPHSGLTTGLMGLQLTGPETIAPTDRLALGKQGYHSVHGTRQVVYRDLTPGLYTIRAKYRSSTPGREVRFRMRNILGQVF